MGGGGPTYNAPAVQKDDTFEKYLAYQQKKEGVAEERAATERAETKAEAAARKAAGAAGYSGLRTGVESQMRQGLLGYETATQQLRDYASKYDLTPPETDVASLTDVYTKELLPGRRKTGIKAAYEETLGRQATEEELTKATERFNQGFYTTNQDLVSSLTKGSEYQDKFNSSYLDNYYDTMFGKQTTDAAGKKTGNVHLNLTRTSYLTMAETWQVKLKLLLLISAALLLEPLLKLKINSRILKIQGSICTALA
jgi:hypothetical protein